MARLTAAEVISELGLEPHPVEGGFYRETHRASEGASSAIYYLLTPATFSEMHRLPADEVFHFYAGDAVQMLLLQPMGKTRTLLLGNDLANGQIPQTVVTARTWQGSRLADGGEWALLGATMAPAFEYADYERGDRDALIRQFPHEAKLIRRLTHG